MLEVVVHDLAQARAALAAAGALGIAVRLRSAPDAAGYAGAGFFQALGEALGHELLVDCGEDAGVVLGALRTGCRRLVFTGDAEVAARLADMAAQMGAELRHETAPSNALQCAPDDDPAARLAAWLAERGTGAAQP